MCRDIVFFLAIRVFKEKSVLGDSVGNYYQKISSLIVQTRNLVL